MLIQRSKCLALPCVPSAIDLVHVTVGKQRNHPTRQTNAIAAPNRISTGGGGIQLEQQQQQQLLQDQVSLERSNGTFLSARLVVIVLAMQDQHGIERISSFRRTFKQHH